MTKAHADLKENYALAAIYISQLEEEKAELHRELEENEAFIKRIKENENKLCLEYNEKYRELEAAREWQGMARKWLDEAREVLDNVGVDQALQNCITKFLEGK